MIDVLAVIPAKASSSRLPGKNLLPLGGVPLFVWTVRAARQVQPPMTVVVSTDEGPVGDEIAKHAVHEGAVVIRRPPELCRDPAQAPDVALHALERYREQKGKDPDTVVMLLPTSPFRTSRHIEEALALFDAHKTQRNVVSVQNVTAHLAHKHVAAKRDGEIFRGVRIHELPPITPWDDLMLNGAIWVTTAARLRRYGYVSAVNAWPYVMGDESGLDIDSPLDYEVAKAIVVRRVQVAA